MGFNRRAIDTTGAVTWLDPKVGLELSATAEIIWAPAIAGGFVMTTRGGDFEPDIGQDISIGYECHCSAVVELYFLETFTFWLLTTDAVVCSRRRRNRS